jgi:hypothetical protein
MGGPLSDFRRAFYGLRSLGWRAARRTRRFTVTAAILGQVADEAIHDGEVGRVKELATFASLRDQSGALQILKMERQ